MTTKRTYLLSIAIMATVFATTRPALADDEAAADATAEAAPHDVAPDSASTIKFDFDFDLDLRLHVQIPMPDRFAAWALATAIETGAEYIGLADNLGASVKDKLVGISAQITEAEVGSLVAALVGLL